MHKQGINRNIKINTTMPSVKTLPNIVTTIFGRVENNPQSTETTIKL